MPEPETVSASITAIAYDDARQELRVSFGARTLVYLGVPSAIHAAFRDAAEPSAFFLDHIRDRFPRA